MARSSNNRIPYDTHPLYTLRRGTRNIAIIGLFLHIIVILALFNGSYSSQRHLPFFLISAFLLSVSIAVVWYDLVTYGTRAALISASRSNTNDVPPTPPDAEESWPSKALLRWDFILAIVLQWLFWAALFDIIRSGYYERYGSSETLEAYANLASFAASILHAITFWKELLARKKNQWRRELDKEQGPCENCGHLASRRDEASIIDPSTDERIRPSSQPVLSNFGKLGKALLPKWARRADIHHSETYDRDVENDAADDGTGQPLPVTPEESTEDAGGPSSGQYGTMSQSVESLSSVPETIVRKKDKGKKRLVDVE